ncbi:hypothetical protein O181_000618 [Austropuccinia psidii MF-1]|uniref:Uncharacterized protein n=1 Tax=Austropuccinia psidii MF-1 TaxID=1389203 RepID=A0A9Q3B963_9BASI|nr:hypothetical protein [Austropuccinia psidii MF-1]
MTNTCDDCQQAHLKFLLIVQPFRPCGQRSSHPRHPCKDSFVVDHDESIPEQEWMPGPQTGRRECFRMISPIPSSINLSTPALRPLSNEQNPPNPPQQDSPVPCIPHKQTLRQPTPDLSGTQWSEGVFREPSQHDEPPIPGPSQPSKPHEDASAHGPEPEVAPTQSMEEHFDTPSTVIIIDDTPFGAPSLHSYPGDPSQCPQEPRRQAPLIPTMRLARNLPAYDQP